MPEELRSFTCERCNIVFEAKTDHGKPRRFCSRACFCDTGKVKPGPRECEVCGKIFKAERSSHGELGVARFCSRECRNTALRKSEPQICPNCNEIFWPTNPKVKQTTCSRKCHAQWFRRDRSHEWKGGVVQQGGRIYRKIDREGYLAHYEGEHRLVAAREIGRPLRRGEAVVCLNRDNDDFRPENLYICPTIQELRFLFAAAVEWPTESNLQTYRVSGYTRPNVKVVLHEWENGQRSVHAKGKPITRHPQADEIIERRKAGATLSELMKAFGYKSYSGMARVLTDRL